MSDIELYLVEVDANTSEALEIAKRAAKKLSAKETKLVEVIESLGDYLNNEDPAIRANTIAYLAEVLTALTPRSLSLQQRNLLIDFILSRLSNGAESIGHCAKGMLALESQGAFTEEQVQKIIKTLFDNTSPLLQFKQQSERFLVLSFINSLMEKYRAVLHKLHESSSSFLSQLIAYFDNEKDPRNLMIVFSILNVPMVEWDVSANAEELFNAVFNYFPITFRPPPNDPHGITAQDLKDRLQDCISSTASFAPYAFPALLDKLDSTSVNVKRDVLQAIIACSRNYGPATMNLYSVTLWDALKYEILNVQEEDMAQKALDALKVIARTLTTAAHGEPLQNYLKTICKECNEHLEDTPTKQSSAAGKILGSACQASWESSNFIQKAVLPQLIASFKASNTLPRKRGLLEVWLEILKSNLLVFGAWRFSADETMNLVRQDTPTKTTRAQSNTLKEFLEPTLESFSSNLTGTAINEVSYRLTALEGLRVVCMIQTLMDDLETSKVIRIFDNIIIHEEPYGREEIKASAIDALVHISHQKPQLVVETAMPEFMAQLPDEGAQDAASYVPILEAFAKLSAEKQVFRTIVIRLKNKLYAAARQQAPEQYCLSILRALLYAFTYGTLDLKDAAVFGSYYQDVVVPFVTDACSASGALYHVACRSGPVMETIGRICNAIMRSQEWVSQAEISRNVYTLFNPLPLSEVSPFKSSAESTLPSTSLLLSTPLIASLQRQAKPHSSIAELLQASIKFMTVDHNMETDIRIAMARQLSLLANKFLTPAETAQVIKPFFEEPTNLLDPANLQVANLQIGFAILKGLVLRTDPLLSTLIPSFLALLSHEKYGSVVSRGFSTALATDYVLSKENHCLIYALHRQRFFTLTVPSLAAAFRAKESTETTRTNILVALSGILNGVPYSLARGELATLVPLLLQSLYVDDAEVKANSIATFSKLVHEDPKLVEQHISDLITRLLTIAVVPRSPSMVVDHRTPHDVIRSADSLPKIRAAALVCLMAFVGSFRAELLLPHKQVVTRTLQGALDDARRSVRAEAVRCRRVWLNLGGVGGDDD